MMERIPKMLNCIEAEIKKALGKRNKMWQQLATQEVKPEIKDFFEKQGEISEGSLVLTYLKSSYITGSHQFKIAIYIDPFVEIYPPHRYINVALLFLDMEADMDIFIKQLDQHFICILKSEIEEIRRYYVELLYVESVTYFKQVFSELQNDIELPAVYFGAELGEVELIKEL